MGISVGGTITGLQAEIHFNPVQLTSSTVTAAVDANTINTDNDSRDEHLKEQDFFDVAHYPKISLKSISFKHKSGNNYSGQFDLTIKGKTKTIEMPFSFSEMGKSVILKGSFKINRLDFGVGDTSLILSNDVTINIETELDKL